MSYIENVNIEDIKKKYGADVSFVDPRLVPEKVGLVICEMVGSDLTINNGLYQYSDTAQRALSIIKDYRLDDDIIEQHIELGGKKYVYKPGVRVLKSGVLTGKGMDFIFIPGDPGTSYLITPYGILIENVLHLYHSCPRSAAAREVFRYGVDRALGILKKRGWKLREEPSDRLKAIRDLISGGVKSEQRRAQESITSYQRDLEYVLSQLPERQKAIDKGMAEALRTNNLVKVIDQKSQEFGDYLAKYSKLEEFRVRDGKIVLVFKDLHMKFGPDTIKLPRYKVELNKEGSSFKVSSPDLSGSYIHPHIFTSGEPCLGNYLTHYAKLVQAGEYCQIVDLIVQYLETYNSASPAVRWDDFVYAIDHDGNLPSDEDEEDHSADDDD